MWSEKSILNRFKMKKVSFKYLCLFCGVMLALLFIYVHYRVNRYEPVEYNFGFDKWTGKQYDSRNR